MQIGGQSWELQGAADPDRLVEQPGLSLESRDIPGWQPYWARIWESALVLAEDLLGEDLGNQHVLDLGCGLGLAGAVAASRGARALLCDSAPPALLFARLNSWPWRQRVRTRRLDWRRDRLGSGAFHRILGADILYDREDWPYLDAFWRWHLRKGGEVWLTEPNRTGSESFADWITCQGWSLTSRSQDFPGRTRPVRLLRLSRKNPRAGGAST